MRHFFLFVSLMSVLISVSACTTAKKQPDQAEKPVLFTVQQLEKIAQMERLGYSREEIAEAKKQFLDQNRYNSSN